MKFGFQNKNLVLGGISLGIILGLITFPSPILAADAVNPDYPVLNQACASYIKSSEGGTAPDKSGCHAAGKGLTACLNLYAQKNPPGTPGAVSQQCIFKVWNYWAFFGGHPARVYADSPYLFANMYNPQANPIQHIIVLTLENHSFDAFLGALNQVSTTGQPAIYSTTEKISHLYVDGISPNYINTARLCNAPVHQHHYTCPIPTPYNYSLNLPVSQQYGPHDMDHGWSDMHIFSNNGKMDQFVIHNGNSYNDSGEYSMGYYDQSDLPYTYWLADNYAIGDKYFCSMMGPTWPNRAYEYAGTSYGMTSNPNWPGLPAGSASYYEYPGGPLIPTDTTNGTFDNVGNIPQNVLPNHNPTTIFDVMDKMGDSWMYYTGDYDKGQYMGYIGLLYPYLYNRDYQKFADIKQFDSDVANNKLPLVTYIDASLYGYSAYDILDDDDLTAVSLENGNSEHPGTAVLAIPNGQSWLAKIVSEVMDSPEWSSTVIFLNYDESGGAYDHVPPPAAVEPDGYCPIVSTYNALSGTTGTCCSASGCPNGVYQFTNLGFRVPFLVISPFAKHHYVSHTVYDHSSILKFIEDRIGAAPLTARDAAANSPVDMLNLTQNLNSTLPWSAPVPTVGNMPAVNPDTSVCHATPPIQTPTDVAVAQQLSAKTEDMPPDTSSNAQSKAQ